MMKRLIIAEQPFEPWTWIHLETDDIRKAITDHFPEWPAGARIYHRYVAQSCDVTPCDERTTEKLAELEGTFYVVVYPGDPISIIIAAIALVAAIVFAFVFKPHIPTPDGGSQQSPNNELAQRSNSQRLNGRIPDIFGQVRSTPDLLSVPYTVFENNQEIEYSYMCIGKGAYDIPAAEVRDGSTLMSDIAGSSAAIYGPNTSPNSGAPQLLIGATITEPLRAVKRFSQVNGQVLRAPDANQMTGSCRMLGPDQVQLNTESGLDFTAYFGVGDLVTLANAGIYSVTTTILSVSTNLIVLANPGGTAAAWNTLSTSTPTDWMDCTLSTSSDKWVGPFIIDMSNTTVVLGNFVAPQGLYAVENGNGNQHAVDINIEFEIVPVYPDGSDRCPAETGNVWVRGSATLKTQCGTTGQIILAGPGRCRVRARRTTPRFNDPGATWMDEVRWRDVYGAATVTDTHFGNITTVYTKTYATAGALSVKERKFNCLVTRKLPKYLGNKTFSSTLYPTQDAADIISFIALDPKIGNRAVSEIDFDQIYATIADVKAYFGVGGEPKAAWFNYTFDNDNISFEETIATVAQAAFCTAYRRGNVMKLSFEKTTEDSVLLFNHRNKLPGTEVRTVRFGAVDDNDGVELEYTNWVDDSRQTLYIPEDKSAINPKKIETIGVRSRVQAYYHAWRAYNKIKYQNVTIEFEATQEADLLIIQDRILVSDNTRPDTQDGEILSQNGLELYLSQPVTVSGSTYTIFVQHADSTVESIPITAGSDNRHIVLGRAPKAPLSLAEDNYARTTFMIVNG